MRQKEKITIKKATEHLCTISRHRFLVCKFCFAIGLYRQGLLHDLSKFSPSEFLVGARYYQGNRSPNNAEREDKGYSEAWLHHKGRNRHHYEYWFDYSTHSKNPITAVKMPGRYVAEMFMDRVAASKIYNGDAYKDTDPLAYYESGNTARFLHPQTREVLEKLLHMLALEGEEATFAYLKGRLHKAPLFRKRCLTGKIRLSHKR